MVILNSILTKPGKLTYEEEERLYRKPMGEDDIMKILLDYCDRNWLDGSIVHLLQNHYAEVAEYTQKKQLETKNYYERIFSLV